MECSKSWGCSKPRNSKSRDIFSSTYLLVSLRVHGHFVIPYWYLPFEFGQVLADIPDHHLSVRASSHKNLVFNGVPLKFTHVICDPKQQLREERVGHAPYKKHVGLDQTYKDKAHLECPLCSDNHIFIIKLTVAEVIQIFGILSAFNDRHGNDSLNPRMPLDLN